MTKDRKNTTGQSTGFYKGERAIFLGNSEIQVVVLPDRGGKIASLYSKPFDRELLWQTPGEKYSTSPLRGGTFGPEDSSGFDDMFPTILACNYSDPPWQDVVMPDHGELWSMPWECIQQNHNSVELSVQGRSFPYSFLKRVEIHGNILLMNYSVTNHSDHFFHCLWAAHPLFATRPGMVLTLPESCTSIVNAFNTEEMGPIGTRWAFPIDGSLDFTSIAADTGKCRKFYVSDVLTEGYCALVDPVAAFKLELRFPVERIPYLGIWINEGGWAEQNNIGIEPASSGMDSPPQAAQFGMGGGLLPWETRIWFLEIKSGLI
jgi:galactose mutarotase-like enzyme